MNNDPARPARLMMGRRALIGAPIGIAVAGLIGAAAATKAPAPSMVPPVQPPVGLPPDPPCERLLMPSMFAGFGHEPFDSIQIADNTLATSWRVMEVWTLGGPSGNDLIAVRVFAVGSDAYRAVVVDLVGRDKLLPHLQFGGPVRGVPGGDGGAGYRLWQAHARAETDRFWAAVDAGE